ncbi:hypothetical protein ECE50_005930 [Chitinophaga sp. Mgbs1]|uniref:Uncharacterized protein n=1 Tax=Chitinophaga solisilvae TaxID=1233460 RepID=A0A433WMI0_9BACT|nr:hypothetical protein [Chitinophaga solisilvae]
MEDLRIIYQSLLYSDGIGQWDRLGAALADDYAQLEERDVPGMIALLYTLAHELNFFTPDNTVAGDWTSLFRNFLTSGPVPALLPPADIAAIAGQATDIEPHIALLLAFLRLLDKARNNLNAITSAHMQFYFSEVLKFPRRQAVADKVHVFFELNRNALPQLIPSGAVLDAGKGPDGQLLSYTTTSDIVVNQAQVAALYSLFVENTTADKTRLLWSAPYDPAKLPGQLLPFGSPQSRLAAADRTMSPVTTGMGISSSLLELEGGSRTIYLKAHSMPYAVKAPLLVDLQNIIQVEITGEKGWIKPQLKKAVIYQDTIQQAWLYVEVLLPEVMPPVTGHSQAVHQSRFPDGVPAMRITGLPGKPLPQDLLDFTTETAALTVDVKGLKKLVVQSEEGVQAVNKPFTPFGSWPSAGSRFFIGNRECFSKKLKNVTVNVQWQTPAQDFKTYYTGYSIPVDLTHTSFQVDADVLFNGVFDNPVKTGYTLFEGQVKAYRMKMTFSEEDLKIANDNQVPERNPGLPDISGGYAGGMPAGFIRLTLSAPDTPGFTAFGHSNYANALALATQKMVQFPNLPPVIPQPPYTPLIREISLDYIAEDNIFPGTDDQVFHITPLGIRKLTDKGNPLFPDFPAVGYLYIGLANLQPEQSVNLLMHLAENDAVQASDPDADYANPVISWAYLAGDEWSPLRTDQLVLDTTSGLQQSGLLSLQTGADAATGLLMPPGLLWLQATLTQGLNRISPLDGIHTQAVEAVLSLLPGDDLADYPLHLAQGLPADTIKQMINSSVSLKSIRQPYASSGGLQPETKTHYITRMSERLRHRNRGINSWDLERLALEAFPGIVKVKCLNGSAIATPGVTRAVVIPRIAVAAPLAKRLQPKASSFLLDQVAAALKARTTAFTTVQVSNPDYEELLADFKVKFNAGFDPAYYQEQLNQDLVRFLSPWAFDDKVVLHFDTEVYRSEIIYFIENLPYVEYIADFKLFHRNVTGNTGGISKMKIGKTFEISRQPIPNIGIMNIGDSFLVGIDWEVVTPSQPAAILVSAPQHTIAIVDTSRVCTAVSGLGIGNMTINIDFIVSKS